MRLNIKFAMAFVSLVLVSVILVFIGISGINFQVSTGKTVFEGSLVPVANLAKMMIKFDALHSDLRDMVEADTLAKADWAFIKMKVPMRDYDDLMEQYIRTIPNNPLTADEKRKIVEDIKEQEQQLVERLVRVAELSRTGEQAESIALFERDLKPVIQLMSANIRLLVDVSIQDAATLGGEMESARKSAMFYMFMALMLGMATSAVICLVLRYFVVKAQDEQQKAYRDTAAVFSEIPAPICVVCRDGGLILDANAAFLNLCSSTGRIDIIGSSVPEYFELPGGESIIEKLRQGSGFKCVLKGRKGVLSEMEMFSKPFVFQDRESFAVFCMDLTRQRLQERALKDAVTAAEEASRMKSAFVANISHEIRTPLNGVIGFAELALDERGLSANIKDFLDKIRISANGLLSIINDVLDISKIESGKMELEKTEFDLGEVFTQCEVITRANAGERDVKLDFDNKDCPDNLIIGDPTKLRQVLLNLLSNAIKFTNCGVVRMSSTLLRREDNSITIKFEVRDSGIGMSAEQLEKIFLPFTQADSSTTRKYGGTGLGLAITKSIIEMMGGSLRAESTLGLGSCFSFTLSFGLSDKSAVGNAVCENTVGQRPIFSGSVLVCEDNAINQQVITGHLARIGLETSLASNGEAGIALFKERIAAGEPFDIILMDIHMPVMDGLCATRMLVDAGCKIPIIAMTANAMLEDRKLYLSRGMCDYIGKPFKSRELWDCLQKYLDPVDFVSLSGGSGAETAPAQTMQYEGGVSEEASPSSSLKEQLKGGVIDYALGLEHSAGSEELYRNLQVDFVRANKNLPDELREAIRVGDIKSAHRIAHSLKSVSGTIGAGSLQQAACAVETDLAAGNAALAEGRIKTLEEELALVLSELSLLNAGVAEDKKEAVNSELNRKNALILLNRLEPLLKRGNSESSDLIGEIFLHLGPLGGHCELLATQIEDFEFESAYETVLTIKKTLENEA